MHPVRFPECNVNFAKDQPEYLPLPAYRDHAGRVVMCWGLTWHERIGLLLRGHFWLSVLTFNHPLQPLRPATKRPSELDRP